MAVAIRNYRTQGIPGGWSVVLEMVGRSFRYDGTPEKIFKDVKEFQLGNNIYKSDADIWQSLNDIWCTKDPKRCTQSYVENKRYTAKPTSARRKILTSSDYGRTIWEQLNYFTVYFQRDLFIAYMDWVINMLDPNNLDNFNAGCSICYNHFKELLIQYPVEAVKDKYDLAEWVVTVHNEVNRRIGKRTYTNAQLVSEYGGPIVEKKSNG